MFMRTLLSMLVAAVLATSAQAGPPSYLLLRQPESPGPHNKPGQPAAQYFDVRTSGYAYGYFGVGPRTHWSRTFGVNRMYTQWSRW
jgi:hypothetical protein